MGNLFSVKTKNLLTTMDKPVAYLKKQGKNLFFLMALAFVSMGALAENMAYELAMENGVKACADQIKELADVAFEGSEYYMLPASHADDPDNRMYESFSVEPFENGSGHVSISASPNPAGKCDITYMRTFISELPCEKARKDFYGQWTFVGYVGKKRTAVVQADDWVTSTYFTPQLRGKACMVSTRIVIYPE